MPASLSRIIHHCHNSILWGGVGRAVTQLIPAVQLLTKAALFFMYITPKIFGVGFQIALPTGTQYGGLWRKAAQDRGDAWL